VGYPENSKKEREIVEHQLTVSFRSTLSWRREISKGMGLLGKERIVVRSTIQEGQVRDDRPWGGSDFSESVPLGHGFSRKRKKEGTLPSRGTAGGTARHF